MRTTTAPGTTESASLAPAVPPTVYRPVAARGFGSQAIQASSPPCRSAGRGALCCSGAVRQRDAAHWDHADRASPTAAGWPLWKGSVVSDHDRIGLSGSTPDGQALRLAAGSAARPAGAERSPGCSRSCASRESSSVSSSRRCSCSFRDHEGSVRLQPVDSFMIMDWRSTQQRQRQGRHRALVTRRRAGRGVLLRPCPAVGGLRPVREWRSRRGPRATAARWPAQQLSRPWGGDRSSGGIITGTTSRGFAGHAPVPGVTLITRFTASRARAYRSV